MKELVCNKEVIEIVEPIDNECDKSMNNHLIKWKKFKSLFYLLSICLYQKLHFPTQIIKNYFYFFFENALILKQYKINLIKSTIYNL